MAETATRKCRSAWDGAVQGSDFSNGTNLRVHRDGVHGGYCGDRISRWVEKYGVQRPEGEAGGLMHVPALRKLSVKDVQRFVGVLVWDVRLRVKNMDTMR